VITFEVGSGLALVLVRIIRRLSRGSGRSAAISGQVRHRTALPSGLAAATDGLARLGVTGVGDAPALARVVILAFCAWSLRLALSASKSGIFVVLIEFSAFCADQAGREEVVDTIWNLHEQPSSLTIL